MKKQGNRKEVSTYINTIRSIVNKDIVALILKKSQKNTVAKL